MMRICRRSAFLALALTLLTAAPASQAIEEPAYEVARQIGGIEIRHYQPYVVAEVVLPGSAQDTGNRGFRILAGYIFGKNKGERRLAMTAPVTQAVAPTQLPKAVPVTRQRASDTYLVQFVLPRDVALETAPVPLDPRIVLREEPPRRVAAIRYSGRWSDANYDSHLAELEAALKAAGLRWTGAPIYSRYNPPITPWFLRRNEIWLRLADDGKPFAR